MSVKMPTAEQITEIVKPLLADDIGVAVGVASPDFDAPAYFFNGSVTARDRSPLTLGSDTLFAIGSCSKTLTATLYATAILRNDGVLDQLLGDSTPAGLTSVGSNYTPLPLGMLANYTSGLPQDNQGGVPEVPPDQTTPYTVPELFAFLNTNPFPVAAPPGTVYAYSNLGFSLLGAVTPGLLAAESTGSWESVLAASILAPLGMTLNTLDQVSPSLLPQSYSQGTKAGRIPIRYPAFNPGGGLVFSSSDVMRWLQYSMGMTPSAGLNDLLQWTQLPSTTIKTPRKGTGLGRGWFLGSNGHVFKDGGVLGFSSFIAFVGSSEVGVDLSPAGAFLLVNQSINPGPYVSRILALMTGTELGDVDTPEVDAAASNHRAGG